MHCKLCNTEQPDRIYNLKPTEFTQPIFDYLGEPCCRICSRAITVTAIRAKRLNQVFNIDHYILSKLYRKYRTADRITLGKEKYPVRKILPGISYRIARNGKVTYLVYIFKEGVQKCIKTNSLQEAVDIRLATYSMPFYRQKFLQAVEKYIKQQGKDHE